MPGKRKTRVLWLIKGLGLGGAEMLFEMAAPHLDRERFDYQIGYFLPWKDALVERLQQRQLPITCFDIPRGFSLRGVRRIAQFCRQQQIDVLHMHLPMPGVMGRLAGKRADVPAMIYTEHNLWSRLNPVSRMINRLTFGMHDRAIAVSQDVADSMSRRYMERVQVINNGIDCDAVRTLAGDRDETRDRLGIKADCLVVGKVANLTPKKNHELLIDAFADLHQAVPNSRLLLVGQFADREQVLRQHASRRGVQDAVIFTGPSTEVPQLVAAMDVFAMSSNFEGLPISLLEAMSLGKASICTSVGGIPQVVRDGQDGFLVDAGDRIGFAAGLKRLAQNRQLRCDLGASAAAHVREAFDIRAMVAQVEQVYCDVLECKGRTV
ncbi:Putative glycosyltransferase EpsD [Roseimaritima ulvae]|uniref:Glycosyltransferase EpsD n=1 Tax=Roseimaritima ulvae TaxID=980254 RepID=A0A5B9QNS8_9BACT|nr:Putative glycosyltransferase EpsD [Roseimaritima ulvae]